MRGDRGGSEWGRSGAIGGIVSDQNSPQNTFGAGNRAADGLGTSEITRRISLGRQLRSSLRARLACASRSRSRLGWRRPWSKRYRGDDPGSLGDAGVAGSRPHRHAARHEQPGAASPRSVVIETLSGLCSRWAGGRRQISLGSSMHASGGRLSEIVVKLRQTQSDPDADIRRHTSPMLFPWRCPP